MLMVGNVVLTVPKNIEDDVSYKRTKEHLEILFISYLSKRKCCNKMTNMVEKSTREAMKSEKRKTDG